MRRTGMGIWTDPMIQRVSRDTTTSTSASIPDYQGRSGCTMDMSDKTPVKFFHLITDQMLENKVLVFVGP